jgi:hypothetical protein
MGVTAILGTKPSDSEALLRSADRKSTGMDVEKGNRGISDRLNHDLTPKTETPSYGIHHHSDNFNTIFNQTVKATKI